MQLIPFLPGVALNKASAELIAGESETLIATVQPSNAANKALFWASDNMGVAAVANGVVTAIVPGTAI